MGWYVSRRHYHYTPAQKLHESTPQEVAMDTYFKSKATP